MLIFNLKQLMAVKGAKEGSHITYADIEAETGIKRLTLTRITTNPNYNISRKDIEKLCLYFDCLPNELMTLITQ